MRPVFPFSAIVGQDEMKLALLVAAVDPTIGGVLVFGDRGTGKSTAVRALAALLPRMKAVVGCRYRCDPAANGSGCSECHERALRGRLKSELVPVPVVDLPLGATEDRVVGALDLDLLLDVAASGENVVEREGLSIRHPARFVLIGTGNPEEGELRPQLLDRFGLSVEVKTPSELELRVEVVRRRDQFERDPDSFMHRWQSADDQLRRKVMAAKGRLSSVDIPDTAREQAARLCMSLGTDGLRGELTLIRAARALAALDRKSEVDSSHLRRVASSALRHRLRRDPLDEAGSTIRVERATADLFGS